MHWYTNTIYLYNCMYFVAHKPLHNHSVENWPQKCLIYYCEQSYFIDDFGPFLCSKVIAEIQN